MEDNESILLSILEAIGPQANDPAFFKPVTMTINSALATLGQRGVGPAGGFRIHGVDEKWSDFGVENRDALGWLQEYIYIKVKIVFDPPSTGALVKAFQDMAAEDEWRMQENAEFFKDNPIN